MFRLCLGRECHLPAHTEYFIRCRVRDPGEEILHLCAGRSRHFEDSWRLSARTRLLNCETDMSHSTRPKTRPDATFLFARGTACRWGNSQKHISGLLCTSPETPAKDSCQPVPGLELNIDASQAFLSSALSTWCLCLVPPGDDKAVDETPDRFTQGTAYRIRISL